MKPCAVYYLVDPLTREPRYIGVSRNPLRRFFQIHLRAEANNHKEMWIKSLQKMNLEPKLVIKCWTTDEDARRIERLLIARLPNLTNCTSGGDGLLNPSKEIRKKISENCRRAVTPEKREKLRRAHLGRKHSLETRQKMSKSHFERWSKIDVV